MDKSVLWSKVSEKHTIDTVTINVWEREITFEKSIFPTSIKVFGKEILSGPIRLNAEFKDILGEWTGHQVIMHEKSDEKVVFSVCQTAENLILNATVTCEFDGFVKIDMSLIPFWGFHKDNVPRLTKFSIDIPVKNEYADLMHYWPNCESGVCLAGNVLNSHKTPDEEMRFAHKPYLWTGWEYGGLGICSESDKNFELDDVNNCMSVKKGKDSTNIHINLLDHTPIDWQNRTEAWGNAIRMIDYSFGIQPTPVKEFNKSHLSDWRAFHIYDVRLHPVFKKVTGNGDTMIEKAAQNGAKWIILHEDWTVIQNYGMPEDEETFKTFVEDCHNLGMKVMVYFGYEVSSLYPGFASITDKYLNKNNQGNHVGGWQREPIQRDYTVCYNGDYSDIMIQRVCHVMDDYGVDGIYTDGTYVPWECANEAHGCGYRDKDGNLKYTYPIFAVREHVKKLYNEVHKRGGIIDTHQSSCCLMATLAFADSYFDGENLQGFLAEDISKLRMDVFRTEFMGMNMGIPCNFISYTINDFTLRKIAGITLLHNVYPRANKMEDLDCAGKLWKHFGDFTQNAEWTPYWDNKNIIANNDNTYVSYYKKGDETLLVICCLDKDVKKLDIKLDDEYKSISDLMDNSLECKIEKNVASVPVDYVDAKLILLKK